MRTLTRVMLAFLAAVVMPALIIVVPYAFGSVSMGDDYGWVRTKNFAVIAFTISAAYVFVLGLPSFLLLKWKNAVYWWSSTLVGFILGCIPVSVTMWPLRYPELKTTASQWDGERMVQTMIDGVPTIAGWFSYGKAVAFMGTFGAIGGMSFWLVWWTLRPNKPLQATRKPARA